ncbi:MAG: hypothetical protein A2252_03990 [Elusimicrobia bacterium RIFOXYA2_FULL_39_19]|nr:MAG: hypothetical protein A2252_03990 [Elusimicrobia bacterium RIFOXYA2_FULL_39_19]
MFFLILITLIAIMVSFLADRQKTYKGLIKGMRMFLNILPVLLNMLVFVSILLYLVPNELIIRWLGKGSGFYGITIAALLGSISMIPGFIAFPLAGILRKGGVSYEVLAVFITTLMMVGVLTLPLESKYFGIKAALLRNGLSLAGAVIIGILIGLFM